MGNCRKWELTWQHDADGVGLNDSDDTGTVRFSLSACEGTGLGSML